jgi:hypothetical protein
MAATPMVVVETESFLKRAHSILSEAERTDLVGYLASYPEAGQVVPETGGVRKIRWALSGKGKRGGARVIYYYHNDSIPLFLLDVYAKNEKADLAAADKRSLKKLLPQIVSRYVNRRKFR